MFGLHRGSGFYMPLSAANAAACQSGLQGPLQDINRRLIKEKTTACSSMTS